MANKHGIVCELCGRNQWNVLETRTADGSIRRWRKCSHCGSKARTTEKVDLFFAADTTRSMDGENDAGNSFAD